MKKNVVFMVSMVLVAIGGCSSNEATVKPEPADVAESNVAEVKTDVTEKPMKVDASKVDASSEVTETTDVTDGYNNKISVCKSGKSIRTISVIYKKSGTSTSCEVTYEKASGVKTLWTAKSDLSYCMDKATSFIKKQEGWGWSCSTL